MTTPEELISAIEQQQTDMSTALTLTEAMDKYDLVSSVYDPVHGSYVVMAERDPKLARSTAFAEMGYASLSPFTAWTRDERVGELRDKLGIRKYYDMKRADGTVRGALRLVKTPVMAARWFVEPASDSTLDKNIANFVEENLFERLNMPWHRVLEDALLMCEYGYMPLEKVYSQDSDGKIILKKLAPRHPLDIQEWIFDANGGPNGIIMDPTEATGWLSAYIPIEKLVVFTLEQEAGDIRGISLLRSAYKHYFYKDCKSEDTEILSQRGWLLHNQLIQGDMVMTINPETGLSEWQPVQYIRRYSGTHDVIQMESQQISSISTPDHRWLVKDTSWASRYEFVTTEKLRQRHIIPRGALNSDIPKISKYEDDLVELVAWFITEGSWDTSGSGCSIAQNADSPDIDRIRDCLSELFGPPYIGDSRNIGQGRMPAGWKEGSKTNDPNGIQFRLNANATDSLKSYVKGKNKVVTNEFILGLTKAQLLLFLDICHRGDGSKGLNEIRQSDKLRLEPIELACILLGYATNIHWYKHTNTEEGIWLLSWATQRVGAKPIQSKARYGSTVKHTTYDGIVWCPKTKNGTWLARRNGKVYYTGNTLYKIDAIQKERHGIGVPIIKLPLGYSEDDRKLAENLGRNMRTNERAHVVIPDNWTVEFAKLEGQPVDCLTSIQHHDDRIMTNILAPFYDDPNAQEKSMTMFYKATRYIASTIGDTFNRYVIKQLVDFNFSRGKYPILRARRIGENEDLRTWSFAYRNLVGTGSIIPDDELEKFLRIELDLPPADPSTARVIVAPQQPSNSGSGKSSTNTTDTPGNTTNPGDNIGPPKVGPPRQKVTPPVGPPKGNAGSDRSGS